VNQLLLHLQGPLAVHGLGRHRYHRSMGRRLRVTSRLQRVLWRRRWRRQQWMHSGCIQCHRNRHAPMMWLFLLEHQQQQMLQQR
jgi:hypothetical protein